MVASKPPSDAAEIARETLRQLAVRRLVPTPDNYRALYEEIAGTAATVSFPEAPLRAIARVLPGQTAAQKRLLEQFEQAIAQHSWPALQAVLVGYANLGLQGVPTAGQPIEGAEALTPAAPSAQLPPRLAETLARLVENTVPAVAEDDARLQEMACQLVALLRAPGPGVALTEQMLADIGHRVSFAAQDQSAIRAALLALLRLLFENIAALSLDDEWLHAQVEALLGAATPPLHLRRLDDLERRLKDVIFKQTEAKEQLLQAQGHMRELLARFMERLAHMDESSSSHQGLLEGYAQRISQAAQLQDITPVLQQAVDAVRGIALASRVTRGELQDLRESAEARHAEIGQLREQLDRASAQARHDALTGSLNRKGLDEALEREVARAQRNGAPLCVALLDLDDFRALNDRLGRAVGDEALAHLAQVARSVLRPQDQLARYGGEEFLIVLPDTAADEGVQALRRLQRELTRSCFLSGTERLLITFSAGVAQVQGQDDGTDALRRADQGMSLAKRSGKNRVVAA